MARALAYCLEDPNSIPCPCDVSLSLGFPALHCLTRINTLNAVRHYLMGEA